MEISVYNREYERIGIIPHFKSLSWKEYYTDKGVFTLVVDDKAEGAKSLSVGNYIHQNGKDTLMVIRYVKYDSVANEIKAHGFSAAELMEQRYIPGTVRVLNAERGMLDIVRDNLRGLPIEVADANGYADEYEAHYVGRSLFERIGQIAAASGLGFKMVFSPREKRLAFTVYKGVDRTASGSERPALFSEEFGNLANTVIVKDDSIFKNTALVAGGGEGENRVFVEVGDAAGLERFELYVDARDLQQNQGEALADYKKRLYNRGVDKLKERSNVNTFVAEVDPLDFPGKFSLGDLITCKSARYGVEVDTRITAYEEITEKNMRKLKITLGTPEVDLRKELSVQSTE